MRTSIFAAAAVALTLAGGVAPASAANHRDRTVLPSYVVPGVGPESVAVALGSGTFWVGSIGDGAVFRGTLDDPQMHPFLPAGQDGRTFAAGIKIDHARHLLVAGGATGHFFVYDRDTGAFIKRFDVVGLRGPTFINDAAVTPNGDVYVTDSLRPVLYRIAAADVGTPSAEPVPLPVFKDLTGTPFVFAPGFNANGIVSAHAGRYLLVVTTNTGLLFRISTADGSVAMVDLHGATLPTADGMAIRGHTLYVIENGSAQLVKIQMGQAFAGGKVVSTTTDPSFETPTGIALVAGHVLVTNARFGGPPTPPFTVSSVPRP